MKKKIALLLIVCIVLSSLALTFATNASDINNHWGKEVIQEWMNKGLINGYPNGTFKPNSAITRAEFMVLVNKAFGFTKKSEINYTDVAKTSWYYDIVATAVAAGYIGGYPDGSMKPNHPISRQEVTVVLSKITDTPQSPSAINRFTDASAIAGWAKGFVGAAVAEGYMGGYPDGTFKPVNNITRAEAVATLNKVVAVDAEEIDEVKEEKAAVYNQAGTYGPKAGTEITTGDVIVKADGVTLQNMVIKGDLTIAEEVGDGDVILNNIIVEGETFIRGGGRDSIHINGGKYNKITVEKTSSGNVRIVANNAQRMEILISAAAAKEEIILEGSFERINIQADNIKVVVQGETSIKEVLVKEGVKEASLTLGNNSTVAKLVVDSKIEVAGQGKVQEALGKEVSKSTFEKVPERVPAPERPTTPSTGGGGGGSTGGGSTAPVVTPRPETYIESILATNGEIIVILNEEPATAVEKAEFNVYKTMDGEPEKHSINQYITSIEKSGKIITLKFEPWIPRSTVEYEIFVSYKGSAVKSSKFIVEGTPKA